MSTFNNLQSSPEQKQENSADNTLSTQEISFGSLKGQVESAFQSMDEQQVGKRLYEKDASLWKEDADEAAMIRNSMGWITLPNNFSEVTEEINKFTQDIKAEGFKYAVLLGMGGSSLSSEVARETFGTKAGFPDLLVLDDTSPTAVLELQNQIELEKTLFIAASKSGGTKETVSFFRYFYGQLQQAGIENPGNHFVAITDPGSPMVATAKEYSFRKTFLNPADIGGRYSVLSNFGLLPMALMGIDINALMERAQQLKISSGADIATAVNPSISLGTTLGICEQNGRDKLTFILSASIKSFGFWVEQLVAESTGKEGKGLIPVNGEPIGNPDNYSNDRIFVHMYLPTDDFAADEQKIKALEAAGHPVIRIKVADKMAIGGEYYRWEIATAVAGIVAKINPFDQPNVEQSKKNTNTILETWKQSGGFEQQQPLIESDGISVFGSNAIKDTFTDKKPENAGKLVQEFLALARKDEYIAFLPYFTLTEYRTEILQNWRTQLRDTLKTGTTLLNGPRYLHSTGQLHKGGADTGLFILMVASEEQDLPIPGEQYGFKTLHEAQYMGDFASLDEKGRRVIRINLGKNIDEGLHKLWASIQP